MAADPADRHRAPTQTPGPGSAHPPATARPVVPPASAVPHRALAQHPPGHPAPAAGIAPRPGAAPAPGGLRVPLTGAAAGTFAGTRGTPGGAPTTALERLAARHAAAATAPASPAPPAGRPGPAPQPRLAAPAAARPGLLPPARPLGAPAAPGPITGHRPISAAQAAAARPVPGAAPAARPVAGTAAPVRTPLVAPPAAGSGGLPAARLASAAGGSTVTGASSTAPRRVPAVAMALPTPAEIEATVDHEAYERFAAGIRALLGFDLNQYKRPQVWRRSNSFAKQKGCADVHELVERCKTDLELRTAMRDMITINVSEFFRNPEAWESLRTMVLPELTKLGRPIRMWSAGCSLGYEPYTFAMMVRESGTGADAKIQATDLDETILAQARASAYAEHQMVGVSPARRAKWFEERDGLAVVRPELRSMVTWRRHDLLRDAFPPEQDLVACRNVVIYFTDDAKDALYRRFAQSLRPGGTLFIGATEAIPAPREFGLQMLTSGIYRRAT
jgi:chemotaxis protein methyltransferase CheR